MPHSILLLDVKPEIIAAELQIPLSEFQLAVPFDVTTHPAFLANKNQEQLRKYFLNHLHLNSADGKIWPVSVDSFVVKEAEQDATGKYQELVVLMTLQPPGGEYTRKFRLFYDGILHQVATHKIFVSVRSDWQAGFIDGQEQNIGVIELDIAGNMVHPLEINLEGGTQLKGFTAMVRLGMNHIAEGIDHILFLLVLLLPAPLFAQNNRWQNFGGNRYSFIRVVKIVTAFTIGHSLSLFLGAMQWLTVPQQPVEILIAVTIIITSVHALKPIFDRKEVLIAAAFGLIHGLAFSSVIAELHPGTAELLYSILGFNIGIELMQLYILLLTMPWLVILASNGHYHWLRTGGAALILIAALGWLCERVFSASNPVTSVITQLANGGKWLVLLLALSALVSFWITKLKLKKEQQNTAA